MVFEYDGNDHFYPRFFNSLPNANFLWVTASIIRKIRRTIKIFAIAFHTSSLRRWENTPFSGSSFIFLSLSSWKAKQAKENGVKSTGRGQSSPQAISLSLSCGAPGRVDLVCALKAPWCLWDSPSHNLSAAETFSIRPPFHGDRRLFHLPAGFQSISADYLLKNYPSTIGPRQWDHHIFTQKIFDSLWA